MRQRGNTNEAKQDKPVPHEKVSIIIDKKQFFAEKNPITGAELKALAGIQPGYDLFKKIPGQADDVKVAEQIAIEIKNGDHFYSAPTTLNPGLHDATARG